VLLLLAALATCGFLLFGATVTANSMVPMLTSCTPPPSGLVSWWPGDGSAEDITDGNDGTLQGGTSFGAGLVGQAFSFDGSADFVAVGNPANLHLGASDFTVDAWVNFDLLVSPPGFLSGVCFGPGCDMPIVNKMAALPLNRDGWRLLKQSDNHFWFCLGSPSNGCDGGVATTVRSTTIAAPDVWYHVAAVKGSQTISIYIDGAPEDSKPLPSFVDTDSAGLFIGYYEGFEPSLMYGRVDEVEIFDRALTSPEIQAIYNAGAAGKCKSPSPVGGIAELPDVAPAQASWANPRAGSYGALAGGAAAVVVVLVAGAWYARRRWGR